jgi:sigma-B regulation protein RsbU (phosphoserine phosphatase)
MTIFRFKSLRQRLIVFMLIPLAVLLASGGYIGFVYARNSMLAQWREAAILELQQEAHKVDMRLSHPKQWIQMFHRTSGNGMGDHHIQEWIIEQLNAVEGVTRVNLTWQDGQMDAPETNNRSFGHNHSMGAMGQSTHKHKMGMDKKTDREMRFHHALITEITPPRYDSLIEHETVSLISDLHDVQGRIIGKLEVVLRFDYLFGDKEEMEESVLWQKHQAFLVDATGKILHSMMPEDRKNLFENNDPLELKTFYAMTAITYGTIIGPGNPPLKVSGFYQLQEAPWNLVMIAPGKEILSPILSFRLYYLIAGSVFIVIIIVLIQWVTGHSISSIKNLSKAAHKVARGSYGGLLPVRTADEVGELIRSFNSMVLQLEERMQLKEALNLAKEVQQNLLPRKFLKIGDLEIAGKSIYCDETGGDYYDFLQFSELGQERVGIAVGDVAGHGIPAALLMTTVRGLLRSRTTQPGSLAQMISDVNRHLCFDTSETGNFMTLFFMLIDANNKEIRWVRAGHEPAIVYDIITGAFDEMRGEGIALGIDESWPFREYEYSGWPNGQIILIGTDGIWETENVKGEAFGKDRIRQILRNHQSKTSKEIVQIITDTLTLFRQTEKQKDDITLVVIKVS